MATYLDTYSIRLLDNNLLDDAVNVSFTSEADYNGNDVSDVLNKRSFGVYRLTKDPVEDAYIINITLSAPLEPSSFAMLPAFSSFYLPSESVVSLRASNLGFDYIEKEFTGKHSRYGVFCDIRENGVQNSFKYWQVYITTGNRAPSEINESLDIKYCFFGDGLELTDKNIAPGFSIAHEDLSEKFESGSGREYWNEKDTYSIFSGLRFQLMKKEDRAEFQKFYFRNKTTNNFLAVVDPYGITEAEDLETMKMVRLESLPTSTQKYLNYFDVPFTLKEVI